MPSRYLQWIEINRAALTHNLNEFRRLIGPERGLLAMVKSNAYGHGMLAVSQIAIASGADWLGVHSLEEGIILRENEFQCPVLVAGYIPFDSLLHAVEKDLRITVYNQETIDRLAEICTRLQKKAFLHVKVETGTYRQGISREDVLSFVQKIQQHPFLETEGICSHFANIEDTTDHSYAQFQLQNFRDVLHILEQGKIHIPLKHIACSAAAILFPKTYFDLIRTGIGLYGLWPSRETYLSCLGQHRQTLVLKPVLSWYARIAQMKRVPQGAFVGYGCTYKATRDMTIAVIPVGYYDGYPRNLSNVSYVLVHGKRAPLRGRVAMNFIVADVTDIPNVCVEDKVVIIGEEGEESVSADTLASLSGTINYEIVACINPLVPRIVIEPELLPPNNLR